MSSAEKAPEFAELYLHPSEQDLKDQRERYKQAVRIGFVEMERITEEIVIPEFEKIGAILMESGYDVEVVVFDMESSVCGGLYVCGAGLRVSADDNHNAMVYTGDPYRFEFTLQTHNYLSEVSEKEVEYHRLNPTWFHKNVLEFLYSTFPEVDFSEFEEINEEEWLLMEGPFILKIEDEEGNFESVAEADTIEEAMRVASLHCSRYKSEDKLVLEDAQGRRVC